MFQPGFVVLFVVAVLALGGCAYTDTYNRETVGADGKKSTDKIDVKHTGWPSGGISGGVTVYGAPYGGYGYGYGNPILTPQHVCWSEMAVSMVRTELPCHLVR